METGTHTSTTVGHNASSPARFAHGRKEIFMVPSKVERHHVVCDGGLVEYYRVFYPWGGMVVLPERLSVEDRASAICQVERRPFFNH